jgi:dolichol-phosphate mannosyltransferase
MPLELTVVVPTLEERGNVERLVRLLEAALAGRRWEVVFVDDDSADGTADLVEALAGSTPHVRCIRRVGETGLASAAIEGMRSTEAAFLAVMDADLQHDEKLLPQMLDILRQGDAEIVVASRFLSESAREGLPAVREAVSRLGNRLANLAAGSRLSDPLTGFFMLRRELFLEVADRLSGRGYKILLDILLSARREVTFREIPMTFRPRHAGESKLSAGVVLEFARMLVGRALRR